MRCKLLQLNFLFLFLSCAHSLWSAEFPYVREFDDKKILLTKENWDHIVDGKQSENGYSGGHEWKSYLQNRLSVGESLVYDHNINAIVAATKKGQGFFKIIESLCDGQAQEIGYHSMFPHGTTCFASEYLSPSFIADVLVDALKNNRISSKTVGRAAKKRTVRTFWAQKDNIPVKGFFIIDENGAYSITTAFPDIASHYRQKMSDKKTKINLSRYSVWNENLQQWVRQAPQTWDEVNKENIENHACQVSRSITLVDACGHSKEFTREQVVKQSKVQEQLDKLIEQKKTFDIFGLMVKHPLAANKALGEMIDGYVTFKGNAESVRKQIARFFRLAPQRELGIKSIHGDENKNLFFSESRLRTIGNPGTHLASEILLQAFHVHHRSLVANFPGDWGATYFDAVSDFFKIVVAEFLKVHVTPELVAKMNSVSLNFRVEEATIGYETMLVLQSFVVGTEKKEDPFKPVIGSTMMVMTPTDKMTSLDIVSVASVIQERTNCVK